MKNEPLTKEKAGGDNKWIDYKSEDIGSALRGLKENLLSFQIDGSISIARTEYLKGQKQGELMMIDKCSNLIDKWFPAFTNNTGLCNTASASVATEDETRSLRHSKEGKRASASVATPLKKEDIAGNKGIATSKLIYMEKGEYVKKDRVLGLVEWLRIHLCTCTIEKCPQCNILDEGVREIR